MQINELLSSQGVDYEVLPHPPAYTSQELAHSVHVPGDAVAKSVLLRVDGKYRVAVLQATHQLDLEKARVAFGAGKVEFASEPEFTEVFPDVDFGVVPPFGSKYGMETWVDEPLTHDERIVFAANTHNQAVKVRYRDFERIERPKVAQLS